MQNTKKLKVNRIANPLYNKNTDIVVKKENPLYVSQPVYLEQPVFLEQTIYEAQPEYEVIDPNVENNWLFGIITRNKTEELLLKANNKNNKSFWLVREKGSKSYVISILKDNIFTHLKIDEIDNHFIINKKIRLLICCTIEDVIKVLSKCPITSYLITNKREPIIIGEQILNL